MLPDVWSNLDEMKLEVLSITLSNAGIIEEEDGLTEVTIKHPEDFEQVPEYAFAISQSGEVFHV